MSLPDSAGRAIAQQAFLVGALELGLDRAVDHAALTGTLSFGGFRRFFLGVRQMLQGQMLPPRDRMTSPPAERSRRQSRRLVEPPPKKYEFSVDKTSHRILVYEIY